MTQRAHFELRVDAIDKPTDRRRWNGDPMASVEATDALLEAVEQFKAVLLRRGFRVQRSGYGVTASAPPAERSVAPAQSSNQSVGEAPQP